MNLINATQFPSCIDKAYLYKSYWYFPTFLQNNSYVFPKTTWSLHKNREKNRETVVQSFFYGWYIYFFIIPKI